MLRIPSIDRVNYIQYQIISPTEAHQFQGLVASTFPPLTQSDYHQKYCTYNEEEGKWYCFLCNAGSKKLEDLCKRLDGEAIFESDGEHKPYVRRLIKTAPKRQSDEGTLKLSGRAIRYYFDTLEYQPLRDFCSLIIIILDLHNWQSSSTK